MSENLLVSSDGKGRTVNFKNCVLVMTSNVGSKRILEVCRSRPVNGGTSSFVTPKQMSSTIETPEPDVILRRMQDNPKVASLIMKASTDGSVMEGIRTAMNGSPADLQKAAKNDPALAKFLQEVWNEISEDDKLPPVSSGLDSIRNSVQASLPLDDDDSLYNELTEVVKEELESAMKPELLNRIDEIVIFSPLTSTNLYNIALRNVGLIVKRATEEHGFRIKVDDELIARIVEEGSSNADQFGARPMRRAAQRYIEDSLSEAIIGSFLKEGSEVTLSLGPYTDKGKPSVVVKSNEQILEVEIEDDSGGIGKNYRSKAATTYANGAKGLETQPVQ